MDVVIDRVGQAGHHQRLVRLALQEEDTLLQKKWNYTEDGWEVFYTFPVSVIQVFFPGYELKSGMKIYAKPSSPTSLPGIL